MINEVLYMEIRLFREFCRKYHISNKQANSIFKDNKIWEYLESCYDTLHMNGDDYILADVTNILEKKGVAI